MAQVPRDQVPASRIKKETAVPSVEPHHPPDPHTHLPVCHYYITPGLLPSVDPDGNEIAWEPAPTAVAVANGWEPAPVEQQTEETSFSLSSLRDTPEPGTYIDKDEIRPEWHDRFDFVPDDNHDGLGDPSLCMTYKKGKAPRRVDSEQSGNIDPFNLDPIMSGGADRDKDVPDSIQRGPANRNTMPNRYTMVNFRGEVIHLREGQGIVEIPDTNPRSQNK